ncbi:MAG: right-handed parallel beta-helix repeat-containing protein [Candidatus Hodarchaeales archaeon]
MKNNNRSLALDFATKMILVIFVLTLLSIPVARISERTIGKKENTLFECRKVSQPDTMTPTRKITGRAALTPRNPIIIIGDTAFNSTNGVSDGNGTEQDPYLIANWFIDGNGGNCIRIESTTSYFIIENCTLLDAALSQQAGISLDNVTNGQLRNNMCNTSYSGILLESSSFNTLSNNTCNRNTWSGIFLDSSSSNTLSNNICNSNIWSGIFFDSSSSNTLSNNTCNSNTHSGIHFDHLSGSHFNILTFNIVSSNTNYGIFISGKSNRVYFNWIWDHGMTNIYDPEPEWNDIFENCFISWEKYDSDHDGLTDEQEMVNGTNPFLADTDSDNFMDGYEVIYGSDPLDNSDYPLLWKEDYDTLLMYLDGNATLLDRLITWADENTTLLKTVYALASGNEIYLQTLNASCITQFEDIVAIIEQLGISVGDTDYDGLSDLEELSYGTSIVSIDTDCDNLNDAFEIKIGTDPLNDDTDNDSYLDGIEFLAGTNPRDAFDFPRNITSTSTSPKPSTTPQSSTNTIPSSGSFPSILLILSMLSLCALYFRKVKKD